MKARAHCANTKRNETKHWEEADTRDELIRAVIHKELWNVALSTKLARDLTRAAGLDNGSRTWQELHDDAVQHFLGADKTTIIPFIVEFDDGTTEEMDINLSASAVIHSGTHFEVGLV